MLVTKLRRDSKQPLSLSLGGARRYKIRTVARNPTDSNLILIDDRLTSPLPPEHGRTDFLTFPTFWMLLILNSSRHPFLIENLLIGGLFMRVYLIVVISKVCCGRVRVGLTD